MEYQLRDYQIKASSKGVWYLQNYKKPFILVLPTGSGKSLVIADICHKINEPILILQPSKEILKQNYDKLLSYGITDISIYSASLNTKEISKFTYATIGSIYKKPDEFSHFKYVIIDECHSVNPKNLGGMYNQFFEAIGCMNICGLTASPYRLTQKYYRQGNDLYYTSHLSMINRIYPFFFKKIAFQIDNETLLNKGYLASIEYFNYQDFDTSDIKINTTGGDYDSESLEKFWSDSRLKKLAKIIQEIDSSVNHNLIFCSSIRQAERCNLMLKEMGLNSDFVTSKDHSKIRDKKIIDFREGKIKHLINVGVLTTGFDFPALDGITLARATISLALYYQMVGRGIRPMNGKVCKVFDITNNVKKMGRIETIKIAKEEDGFRDKIVTEIGEITNKPLFTFKIKDEKKKEKLKNIQ